MHRATGDDEGVTPVAAYVDHDNRPASSCFGQPGERRRRHRVTHIGTRSYLLDERVALPRQFYTPVRRAGLGQAACLLVPADPIS